MTKNRPELFVQQVDRGGFKPIWPISSNRAPKEAPGSTYLPK